MCAVTTCLSLADVVSVVRFACFSSVKHSSASPRLDALPRRALRINFKPMRKTAWIWFLGCAVWIVDGVVNLRLRALPHAQLAFMVAMVFFVAGLFYRNQKT